MKFKFITAGVKSLIADAELARAASARETSVRIDYSFSLFSSILSVIPLRIRQSTVVSVSEAEKQ